MHGFSARRQQLVEDAFQPLRVPRASSLASKFALALPRHRRDLIVHLPARARSGRSTERRLSPSWVRADPAGRDQPRQRAAYRDLVHRGALGHLARGQLRRSAPARPSRAIRSSRGRSGAGTRRAIAWLTVLDRIDSRYGRKLFQFQRGVLGSAERVRLRALLRCSLQMVSYETITCVSPVQASTLDEPKHIVHRASPETP